MLLKSEDIRLDVYRGGTFSIHMTHVPTGQIVFCDSCLSQVKCEAHLREKLREKVAMAMKLPYPYCIGNPRFEDCIDAGFCKRDPNCGD